MDFDDRLETAEDGSVTLPLRRPLATKDGDVGFLTLRRPTLDELVGQDRQKGGPLHRAAWLMCRISGVAEKDFDDIDAGDAMILASVIGGFLDRLPGEDDRQPGDLPDRHSGRITVTDDGATLDLRGPLATKDGEVTRITLRRPTFKEMKGMGDKPDLQASAKLISILSGVGPLHLGRIDALDGLILGDIVNGFLGNARPGGGR